MDNINDLIGDAAKQLMAQADGIQNQRLKESAQRVALTVSAKTRDETIAKARNAAFARIPIWAFFLPVTRRQAREANGEGADALRRRQAGHVR